MKRVIAGATIAIGAGIVGIGVAGQAQAAPACSYFGSNPSSGICGAPSLGGSMQNAQDNLKKNLSPQNALNNLKKNLGLGG